MSKNHKRITKDEDIINFYNHIPKKYLNEVENPNYDIHNIEIPFRMAVVAPSGSGKTNFVCNLLKVFSKNPGTFADVYIITANKDEPLYNYLEGEFNGQIRVKEGLNSLPRLDDFDKKENHLVIIDDLVLEKNLDAVKKYFIRARKLNVSVAFLSQSYFDIPTIIRKNCTYLVVMDLGGSNREIKAIMSEWAGELDRMVLFAMYHDAVSEHLRPFIIKGGKTNENQKYRKGWRDYYNVQEYKDRVAREESKEVVPKKRRGKKVDVDSSSDEEA